MSIATCISAAPNRNCCFRDMDDMDLYEEAEFDDETQLRLDTQVDKLLKGYDWTLAPLANR